MLKSYFSWLALQISIFRYYIAFYFMPTFIIEDVLAVLLLQFWYKKLHNYVQKCILIWQVNATSKVLWLYIIFRFTRKKTQLKNAVFVNRNSISLPFKINHIILHLSITPNFNLLQYIFIIFPISLVLPPLLYTFYKPITFQG